MAIEKDDLDPMLDEIDRFARSRVKPASERPERPIDISVLVQLTAEALDLGLLRVSGDQVGCALWESNDSAPAMAFNIGVLRHIARANTGVALAWHRAGLAAAVASRLSYEFNGDPLALAIVPTGHYGLARTSLARWLRGGKLDSSDVALLADWLDRSNPTVLLAPTQWSAVIWPVWDDGMVNWERCSREQLRAVAAPSQHGIDELSTFMISRVASPSDRRSLSVAEAQQLYANVLKMDMIGLLAIAAGALARGQEVAADYARTRRQGGSVISAHAAVQQMLGDIFGALTAADLALQSFAQPLGQSDLGAVVATRSALHSSLCHASNQVMQLHGGIGYMRDCGPEKLVRDTNMLRFLAGGLGDLGLFTASWTGGFA